MSFSGAEWESVGARSVPRLWLTEEQPGLCAESRGPGSLSREEEGEEETVGGFMGVFAAANIGACGHLVKKGRAKGGGEGGGGYGFVGLK